RYQSAQDFYQALQAVTEQTTHSTRSRREAIVNQKRPVLRIVIDSIPKQPRTCGAIVKAWWRLLVGDARSLTNFTKERSKIIYCQRNRLKPKYLLKRLLLPERVLTSAPARAEKHPKSDSSNATRKCASWHSATIRNGAR